MIFIFYLCHHALEICDTSIKFTASLLPNAAFATAHYGQVCLTCYVCVLSDNDYLENTSANLLRILTHLAWTLGEYMLFPLPHSPISESPLLISKVDSLGLPRH